MIILLFVNNISPLRAATKIKYINTVPALVFTNYVECCHIGLSLTEFHPKKYVRLPGRHSADATLLQGKKKVINKQYELWK